MKIHYFNPGHETAVQNGSPYYTAPANVVTMQRELALLPAWYALTKELVFTQDKTDSDFLSHIHQHFANFPETVTPENLTLCKDAEVSLWGISPQAIHFFKELSDKNELNLNVPAWHDEYLNLNSRQAARDCLTTVVSQVNDVSDKIIPRFYTQLEDINEAVNNSSTPLLAKAPYSSSGRGLLWLPVTGLTRTENQILHGMLKKQGSVSVEEVLDKQTDFAMEFMADGKGGVEFVGYSLFYTNSKGAYEGNYIGSQDNIEKLLSQEITLSLLEMVKATLINILADKYAKLYKGCIGVDMLIYKEDDVYKLHPCLEINMRYNMGYLAIQLSNNYIHPTSLGKFHLDFSPKEGDMFANDRQMQQQYPPLFQDGKLCKGYLSLCPINESSKYRAYVLIG